MASGDQDSRIWALMVVIVKGEDAMAKSSDSFDLQWSWQDMMVVMVGFDKNSVMLLAVACSKVWPK